MTKEEILNTLNYELHQIPSGGTSQIEATLQSISNALDRYALAVVEQSVPEEEIPQSESPWYNGFNECRSQVLENALRIIGGGENEEKG